MSLINIKMMNDALREPEHCDYIFTNGERIHVSTDLYGRRRFCCSIHDGYEGIRALYIDNNMVKDGNSMNYEDRDQKGKWINPRMLPLYARLLRRLYPNETLNIMILEGEIGNSVNALLRLGDNNIRLILPQFDPQARRKMMETGWYRQAVAMFKECTIINDLASNAMDQEFIKKGRQCHLFFMDLMCSPSHPELQACVDKTSLTTLGRPSVTMFVCSVRGHSANRDDRVTAIRKIQNQFRESVPGVKFGEIYPFAKSNTMVYMSAFANFQDSQFPTSGIMRPSSMGFFAIARVLAKTHDGNYSALLRTHKLSTLGSKLTLTHDEVMAYCDHFSTFLQANGTLDDRYMSPANFDAVARRAATYAVLATLPEAAAPRVIIQAKRRKKYDSDAERVAAAIERKRIDSNLWRSVDKQIKLDIACGGATELLQQPRASRSTTASCASVKKRLCSFDAHVEDLHEAKIARNE